jgi:hypothetical protein
VIGLALGTILAVSQVPPESGPITLQDRNFRIGGFFCRGKGCESYPRRLGPDLRFAGDPHGRMFDGVDHLTQSWSVMLDCAVARDRLRACRVVGPSDGVIGAATLARQLIRRVRLSAPAAGGTRAIVDIWYEPGNCPSWQCVPTPPPPPPPTDK